MEFTAEELAALNSDLQRIAVFFRLATDPVVRVWLGVGRCAPGSNSLDVTLEEYSGLGELSDAPAFQQLINGEAERVEFSMSGISAKVMALAASESESVRNKQTNLGFAIMDRDWQMIGPVHWCWNGYADFVSVDIAPADGPNGTTIRSAKLSVGSTFTNRKNHKFSFWTDPDQQGRAPGDRFCERVVKYSQYIQKIWPRF